MRTTPRIIQAWLALTFVAAIACLLFAAHGKPADFDRGRGLQAVRRWNRLDAPIHTVHEKSIRPQASEARLAQVPCDTHADPLALIYTAARDRLFPHIAVAAMQLHAAIDHLEQQLARSVPRH